MSRLLHVSRSGYYKWEKSQVTRLRGEDKRQRFLDQLDKRIHDIWEDSDEVYGAPRITAELVDEGIIVNRKTVAKRMRMMGIEGISPRAFVPVTTIQSKRKSTLPDLVNDCLIKVSSTGCGCQILPIYAPGKAGCICVRFGMDTPGGS